MIKKQRIKKQRTYCTRAVYILSSQTVGHFLLFVKLQVKSHLCTKKQRNPATKVEHVSCDLFPCTYFGRTQFGGALFLTFFSSCVLTDTKMAISHKGLVLRFSKKCVVAPKGPLRHIQKQYEGNGFAPHFLTFPRIAQMAPAKKFRFLFFAMCML